MMDENVISELKKSHQEYSRNKGSSTWLIFGLVLLMVIAIGAAGIYMDYRLQLLESKILEQTEQVYVQSQNTKSSLHRARQEILKNRAESAKLAQKVSTTIEDFSKLLNSTIDSFSQHTSVLTEAIEKKDESQLEFLKQKLSEIETKTEEQSSKMLAIAENVSKELADTKQSVHQSNTQAEQTAQQVALLASRMEQMKNQINNGFTNLTDVSKELNTIVNAQFDSQMKTFTGELAALKKASGDSMNDIDNRLASLSQEIDGVEKTEKTIQQNLSEHKQSLNQLASTMDSRLSELRNNVELGFAATEENAGIIRSDIAEMNYSLNGKTEDLLIEFTDSGSQFKKEQLKAAKQFDNKIAAIQKSIDGISRQISQTSSFAADTHNLIEEETISDLRGLADEVLALREQVASRIKNANDKVTELLQQPQSEGTLQNFQSVLKEFSLSIQETQEKVKSIRNQLTSLATKLTYVGSLSEVQDIKTTKNVTIANE